MLFRELNATAAFAFLVLTSLMMLPSVDTLLPKSVDSLTFARSSPLSLSVPSAFTFMNLVVDVLTRSLTLPAVHANSSVCSC